MVIMGKDFKNVFSPLIEILKNGARVINMASKKAHSLTTELNFRVIHITYCYCGPLVTPLIGPNTLDMFLYVKRKKLRITLPEGIRGTFFFLKKNNEDTATS